MRKVVVVIIMVALVLGAPALVTAGEGESGPVRGHGGGELL